jgi:osmoprotectant transport system permease protein
MYGAVSRGSVDVVSAYTSDARITAYDLVVLEDPRPAFPPYDAVLLVSHKAAGRPDLVGALRPLVGAIPMSEMRKANRRVDVERQTVRRAAGELRGTIGRSRSHPFGS